MHSQKQQTEKKTNQKTNKQQKNPPGCAHFSPKSSSVKSKNQKNNLDSWSPAKNLFLQQLVKYTWFTVMAQTCTPLKGSGYILEHDTVLHTVSWTLYTAFLQTL